MESRSVFSLLEGFSKRAKLQQLLVPAGVPLGVGLEFDGNSSHMDTVTEDMDLIFEKNNLAEIVNKIKEIMKGQFVTENKRMRFRDTVTGATIPIANMSEGLKSIALLERIVSYGLLVKDTVLILDEPEINLHPEWQLAYAEIIVMLQEELDLKVVLTTHSPYFVKAIEYYAKLYDRSNVCHYYYATNGNGGAEITNVDDMTDIIFKKLAIPLVGC